MTPSAGVVEDERRLRGWRDWAPFIGPARRLLAETGAPAVDRLPPERVTWTGERNRVHDLACVDEHAG